MQWQKDRKGITMQYILNASQMKQLDAYTIEEIGIPSMVLMERAALAVADAVSAGLPSPAKIAAVCGVGNNGGDGVAAARILRARGYEAAIIVVGDQGKASQQMKQQLEIARHFQIPILNQIEENEYNGIIDALFGIGITREIEGEYAEAVAWMNRQKALRFSVDMPSGIHTDNGSVCGIAVKAHVTITFGYEKPGLLFYPGRDYAGKVLVADIGFPKDAYMAEVLQPKQISYGREELQRMPERPSYSHKGTFGRVLIIAGSEGMSGACVMAAKAAYRIGAGLVQVLTTSCNRMIVQTALPEAVVTTYEDVCEIEKLEEAYEAASAIVAGPGLGKSEGSLALVQDVLSLQEKYQGSKPLVLDADALNLLAEQTFWKEKEQDFQMPSGCILTPHAKELARLLDVGVAEVKQDFLPKIEEMQTRLPGSVLVAKDACTVVSAEDFLYLNRSGCEAMATGGSGDVLAGILGGLLAQGLFLSEAARLGTYVHGLAGEAAAEKRAGFSVLAGDIIESIGCWK